MQYLDENENLLPEYHEKPETGQTWYSVCPDGEDLLCVTPVIPLTGVGASVIPAILEEGWDKIPGMITARLPTSGKIFVVAEELFFGNFHPIVSIAEALLLASMNRRRVENGVEPITEFFSIPREEN